MREGKGDMGMPDVASFEEIAQEFERRVRRMVWAIVATVDTVGRPRTRLLHLLWEGSIGWVATEPASLKAKHLARNPHVSIGYSDPVEPVYVEATAEWVEEHTEKQRIWDFIKGQPEPYGYDPAIIPQWRGGPESERFGLLRLTPSRIELYRAPSDTESRIWRASR
jgi:general stress protein 26